MTNSQVQKMMPSRPRKDPAPVNSAAATKISDSDKGARKHTITPPASDRVDPRTSFSSIKENSSGVAQSFTDSKTSSYLRHAFELDGSEDAILDDAGTGAQADRCGRDAESV
jgi:hypothetical protein